MLTALSRLNYSEPKSKYSQIKAEQEKLDSLTNILLIRDPKKPNPAVSSPCCSDG